MNPALTRLLWLRMRGGFRHRIRQMRSAKGLVFAALVIGIVWMVVQLGNQAAAGELSVEAFGGAQGLRAQIDALMPLGLFSACVFTVFVSSGPALYFSRNEINFLYAGPFERRDLVVYKICAYFAGAVVSASILTLLVPPHASSGPAAFTGTLLTLLFIQFGSAAARIVAQAYDGGLFARAKIPVVIGLSVVAVLSVFYITATTDRGALGLLTDFSTSWTGSVLLAPFAVYTKVFLAERLFPDLVGWAALGIAINVVLLLVIVALDGRTAERTLAESGRLHNRWRRIESGGSLWASDKTTGHSIKRIPVLGGIGPVAWRQGLNAVRNSGRAILVFFAIAAVFGPMMTSADISLTASGILGLIYFFIAFILPRTLVCDFRGELTRFEHYKAMPVAPWRICVAQLIVPVLISSGIQLTMVVTTAPFLDLTSAVILVAMLIYLIPFNVLLYGIENIMFLLFPSKLVPVGRVDFDFLGRTLVDFMIKTLIIVVCVAFARYFGIVAQNLTGEQWVSFGLVSVIVLSGFALLTIPGMAWAFRRFSVSETIE